MFPNQFVGGSFPVGNDHIESNGFPNVHQTLPGVYGFVPTATSGIPDGSSPPIFKRPDPPSNNQGLRGGAGRKKQTPNTDRPPEDPAPLYSTANAAFLPRWQSEMIADYNYRQSGRMLPTYGIRNQIIKFDPFANSSNQYSHTNLVPNATMWGSPNSIAHPMYWTSPFYYHPMNGYPVNAPMIAGTRSPINSPGSFKAGVSLGSPRNVTRKRNNSSQSTMSTYDEITSHGSTAGPSGIGINTNNTSTTIQLTNSTQVRDLLDSMIMNEYNNTTNYGINKESLVDTGEVNGNENVHIHHESMKNSGFLNYQPVNSSLKRKLETIQTKDGNHRCSENSNNSAKVQRVDIDSNFSQENRTSKIPTNSDTIAQRVVSYNSALPDPLSFKVPPLYHYRSKFLEEEFCRNPFPSIKRLDELCLVLGTKQDMIIDWFFHRHQSGKPASHPLSPMNTMDPTGLASSVATTTKSSSSEESISIKPDFNIVLTDIPCVNDQSNYTPDRELNSDSNISEYLKTLVQNKSSSNVQPNSTLNGDPNSLQITLSNLKHNDPQITPIAKLSSDLTYENFQLHSVKNSNLLQDTNPSAFGDEHIETFDTNSTTSENYHKKSLIVFS